MTLSRFLPLCFVGALCSAHAVGQSTIPATPKAPTPFLSSPALTDLPPYISFTPQPLAPAIQFTPDSRVANVVIGKGIPQRTGPCYALRSYVINGDDMKSSAPRPSSASTCTDSAMAQMKDVQIKLIQLKPLPVPSQR